MKKPKVGRNDLCPCGNGKKYKKCHGASSAPQQVQSQPERSFSLCVHPANTVPPEVLAKAMAIQREHREREQERTRRFGLVRPEIAVDYHGYKFVAIGNILLYMPSERCRFLTDVLLAYVPQLFGREWFEQEVAKPRLPDGSFGAPPTGPLLAYITFAYDLYVVAHNARLDKRLIERLKQMEQFQGARHELFAEATCLRAGFKIEHENEDDRSSRHAEFTATHVATGQPISVEAKSKHRPGVLGQTGVREPSDAVNLRFGYLLNDAVAKNPAHPLVVFLDTNMPFEAANRFLFPRPPHPFILRTLNRMRNQHGGKDPITQLVITSLPGHYTGDNEISQPGHLLGYISPQPLKPARVEALLAITQATNLYGNVPQELPKTR